MKPEDLARESVDQQLAEAGWIVQDPKQINISAGPGIAVREFRLEKGRADYLLYADGKAIAAVEAKPEGYSLTGVEPQVADYTKHVPEDMQAWHRPLPFAYLSTGKITKFINGLEPKPRSREVFCFHRPEELIRLAKAGTGNQLRTRLQNLPAIQKGKLWEVQQEAIENLELSLKDNRPRSLIQMATGSGKTFTAVTFCYRLIKHAGAKRILFLVDRNNLGRQTVNEFQQYQSPASGYKFTEEYNVQRLTRNTIDPASKVVVTTIQRLYSILKGEEDYEEENEEGSLFESGGGSATSAALTKEPVPVVYNPKIPIETFDIIVVDECHRSIYNVWRQVLEYFDAFIIGLTATPTPQTVGFFNNNVVQDYSHTKAVVDGVNVGYDVYRIETQVTANGASIVKEPGLLVPFRDKRTRQRKLKELEDDLTYTANQLDRDVVSEDQIRLVIRTFKDRLFTEIFPGRTKVPKTLVFAKTDSHAEDIVRIFREEFAEGNDFCQKITSKTTGKKPEELLNEFRNSFYPRVAVTVDMIATGTDVKPLECLLFMRNINSAAYFEQMKGRGVRVIQSDDLQQVTPDTKSKTRFVIVDAVGVCENDKTTTKPLDAKPHISFEKIMEMAAQGRVHPDLASTLAARLSRLDRQLEPDHHKQIADVTGGVDISTLARALAESIDPDLNTAEAAKRHKLPDGQEPTEAQVKEVEKERVAQALKPFHNPKLRDTLLGIKRSLEQVIDELTRDQLLGAGFSKEAQEKARGTIENFQRFIKENKDEIEALQILYSRPYRAGLRYRHIKDLAAAIKRPPLGLAEPHEQLWRAYEAAEPDHVKGHGGRQLVDLVALVRHAIEPASPLVPVATTIESRYHEWLMEQEQLGTQFTPDQMTWLTAIKDHIKTSLTISKDDFNEVPFNQMGGLSKVYEVFRDRWPGILDELNERLAA